MPRNMTRPPGAMIIVDIMREHNAVREGVKLGIPIVALIDTNCDPTDIDYPIPCNDDGIRSIKLIIQKIAEAVEEGRALRKGRKKKEDSSPEADSSPKSSSAKDKAAKAKPAKKKKTAAKSKKKKTETEDVAPAAEESARPEKDGVEEVSASEPVTESGDRKEEAVIKDEDSNKSS